MEKSAVNNETSTTEKLLPDIHLIAELTKGFIDNCRNFKTPIALPQSNALGPFLKNALEKLEGRGNSYDVRIFYGQLLCEIISNLDNLSCMDTSSTIDRLLKLLNEGDDYNEAGDQDYQYNWYKNEDNRNTLRATICEMLGECVPHLNASDPSRNTILTQLKTIATTTTEKPFVRDATFHTLGGIACKLDSSEKKVIARFLLDIMTKQDEYLPSRIRALYVFMEHASHLQISGLGPLSSTLEPLLKGAKLERICEVIGALIAYLQADDQKRFVQLSQWILKEAEEVSVLEGRVELIKMLEKIGVVEAIECEPIIQILLSEIKRINAGSSSVSSGSELLLGVICQALGEIASKRKLNNPAEIIETLEKITKSVENPYARIDGYLSLKKCAPQLLDFNDLMNIYKVFDEKVISNQGEDSDINVYADHVFTLLLSHQDNKQQEVVKFYLDQLANSSNGTPISPDTKTYRHYRACKQLGHAALYLQNIEERTRIGQILQEKIAGNETDALVRGGACEGLIMVTPTLDLNGRKQVGTALQAMLKDKKIDSEVFWFACAELILIALTLETIECNTIATTVQCLQSVATNRQNEFGGVVGYQILGAIAEILVVRKYP